VFHYIGDRDHVEDFQKVLNKMYDDMKTKMNSNENEVKFDLVADFSAFTRKDLKVNFIPL